MKIQWSIFICVLICVFYIDRCHCKDFTLDNESDAASGTWTFSSNFSTYAPNLAGLKAKLENDSSNYKNISIPAEFWKQFDISANTASGIWAWKHYPQSGDATQSVTFSTSPENLIGNVSLSYYIYGNGYITVSSNKDRTVENCAVRITTTTTTTTDSSYFSNDDSESEAKSSFDLCDTDNRQWNYTIVEVGSCNNNTFCGGATNFTIHFHFEETNDNFTSNGGFIFLDKLVALTYIPPPPTEPPQNTTTTTTSTIKTTESTTESFSVSLKPGFVITFLTMWTMLLIP